MKVRKAIGYILIICFTLCSFVGCNQNPSAASKTLIGTWKIEKIVSSGHELTASEMQSFSPSASNIPDNDNFSKLLLKTKIIFKEAGKVDVKIGDKSYTGVWKQNNEKIVISNSDGQSELKFDGNKLSMEKGDANFIFMKE